MKKIPSLFKRDFDGNPTFVLNKVTEGCEWVIAEEGTPTEKFDGTACLIRDGLLYKRYDRKLTKSARKRKNRDPSFVPCLDDFKAAPEDWEPCEPEPDLHTGHWPGWVLVGNGPEDASFREAYQELTLDYIDGTPPCSTYELVGPKIQANPYQLRTHHLYQHGGTILEIDHEDYPRTFEGIKEYLSRVETIEGIVWHHPDGRMCKIKRSDFGFTWNTYKGENG